MAKWYEVPLLESQRRETRNRKHSPERRLLALVRGRHYSVPMQGLKGFVQQVWNRRDEEPVEPIIQCRRQKAVHGEVHQQGHELPDKGMKPCILRGYAKVIWR